jgi:hypothetical protein
MNAWLVIRNMKIKTTMKYHCTFSRRAKIFDQVLLRSTGTDIPWLVRVNNNHIGT